jgi:predicted nucleic acid-binding protein
VIVEHYVLDVSVGIKWFLPELHHGIALDLLSRAVKGEIRLHVPDFFFAEAGNIVWKKTRRSELQASEAAAMLHDMLEDTPLIAHPTVMLVPYAFDVAVSSGIALYDALYVALADLIGCAVITADDKLRQKLFRTTWNKRIQWIADIQ